MFLAGILDVVGSKELRPVERRRVQDVMRAAIGEASSRFAELLPATPAITAGDSVEIVSTSWEPVAFLATYILSRGIPIRIGVGTGELTVLSDSVNECDGPALWLAREALEEARERGVPVSFKGEPGPEQAALVAYLLYVFELSAATVRYLLELVWNGRRVSEVARAFGRTAGTVSAIAKRHGFDALRRAIRGGMSLPPSQS